MPKDYIYFYKDLNEAAGIIKGKDFPEWEEKAKSYQSYVKKHYNPEKIYGEMLERIGL